MTALWLDVAALALALVLPLSAVVGPGHACCFTH